MRISEPGRGRIVDGGARPALVGLALGAKLAAFDPADAGGFTSGPGEPRNGELDMTTEVGCTP